MPHTPFHMEKEGEAKVQGPQNDEGAVTKKERSFSK
jgi:hypothetical protein